LWRLPSNSLSHDESIETRSVQKKKGKIVKSGGNKRKYLAHQNSKYWVLSPLEKNHGSIITFKQFFAFKAAQKNCT
jgi:hypothetical protein